MLSSASLQHASFSSSAMLNGVTKERYQKIMKVLRKRQPDLTILAENVYKPHNLSAMIRSCDAVGIGTVHALNPTGGVPTYNETSASANKWTQMRVITSLRDVKRELDIVSSTEFIELSAEKSGMQLLAAHLSDKAIDYRQVDYTKPTCIIFGNEKEGVSEEAAETADAHIIIPMLGMVPSLNVSVAAAVILFEAQRQRLEAGLYDAPQLTEEAMNAQAFRWLYPRQAELLDARGEPLPELDEEGVPLEAVDR